MDHVEKTQTLGAFMLLFVIIVVAVYDVYATRSGSPDRSISYLIGVWSSKYPVLPLALGVILGHIFWPGASKQ